MSNDDKPNSNEFCTSDLYFAAFLRARGLVMVDMEHDGRKVVWVFEVLEGMTIKRLTTSWFSGGEVEALAYANAVKALKSSVAGV